MTPNSTTAETGSGAPRASQARSRGRVEVVVYRHPDLTGHEGTTVEIVINGVRVDDPEITLVDPGRGHRLDEWREACAAAVAQASPVAAALISEFYLDGEETSYVA